MDKFPSDLLTEIRQLRARVETLEAQARQREGLTSASQGWKIGNMPAPPTPTGGGHLFAAGGDPFWTDSSGAVHELITPPFPQASAVANQDPLETDSSAPTNYSSTWGQRVRTDLVATRAKVFEIQTALRTSVPPLMDS